MTMMIDGVKRAVVNSAGAPIHGTEEGVRNFWRWFGESKMVDRHGRPVVVYHGTFYDLAGFSLAAAAPNAFLGKGVYFTDSRVDAAANYANPEKLARLTGEKSEDTVGNRGLVIPAYVLVKTPLYVGGRKDTVFAERDGSFEEFLTAFREIGKESPEVPAHGIDYMAGTRFPKEAKNGCLKAGEVVDLTLRQIGLDTNFESGKGHNTKMDFLHRVFLRLGFDGVVDALPARRFGHIEGMTGLERSTCHYVVRDPRQIKSAIGNSGAFAEASSDFCDRGVARSVPSPRRRP